MPVIQCAVCGKRLKVPDGVKKARCMACKKRSTTSRIPSVRIEKTQKLYLPNFVRQDTTDRNELKDFKIIEKIGGGGMGDVYTAEQLSLNRRVALKILKQTDDPHLLELFSSEALVTAELEHPNITPIHTLDKIGSRLCFSMKLVQGVSWELLLHPERCSEEDPQVQKRAQNMSLLDHLHVFQQVCNAVAFAHSKKIIHRDLKPENIMIGEFGEVLVMDWGLAVDISECETTGKTSQASPPLTEEESGDSITFPVENKVYRRKAIHKSETDGFSGTLSYMSPEQARSEKQGLGVETDIYLLGAILYEILTGTPPHLGGTTWEILTNILVGNIEPPEHRAMGKEISSELSAICLKAMSRERKDRYASVMDLSHDIRMFFEHRSVSAKEDTLFESLVKFIIRNKEVSIATVISFLLLLMMGIVSFINIKSQRDRAMYETYVAQIGLSGELIKEGDMDQAEHMLDNSPVQHRHWEWDRLKYLCHLEAVTYKGHTDRVVSAVFSEDGKRILTASSDSTARVWDIETGKELLIIKGHTSGLTQARFSKDSKWIVTSGEDGTAHIWDAYTGKEVQVVTDPNGAISDTDISPDCKLLLTTSSRIIGTEGNKAICIWDISNINEKPKKLEGHTAPVPSACFSPDGQYILSGSYDNSVRLWDVKTCKQIREFSGHQGTVNKVTFSADGSTILTGSRDKTVRVWDTQTGKELKVLRGHTLSVTSVAFSPDKKYILSGGFDNNVKLWDAERGVEIYNFRGHSWHISSVAFSPDGKWILSASHDRTAKLWYPFKNRGFFEMKGLPTAATRITAALSPDGKHILAEGGDGIVRVYERQNDMEIRRFVGHFDAIRSISFSADGERVITGSKDQTACVWDFKTGKQIVCFKKHTKEIYSCAFSPDGTRSITGSLDTTARVWNSDTGDELLVLKHDRCGVISAVFSEDGKFILTSCIDYIHRKDNTIRLFESVTGKEVRRFKDNGFIPVKAIFSPDGTRILAGGWDKTARVWDIDTSRQILILKGHQGGVLSVDFSKDSKRIITGSLDGTVRIWDSETGRELYIIYRHVGIIYNVQFTPDGKEILIAGENGYLAIIQSKSE